MKNLSLKTEKLIKVNYLEIIKTFIKMTKAHQMTKT